VIEPTLSYPLACHPYANAPARGPLLRFKVFEPDPTSCAQAVPCLFDAAQEPRVMFEPVFVIWFRKGYRALGCNSPAIGRADTADAQTGVRRCDMVSISLAAAFWLGLHLIVAGPLRARLVGALDERHFRGIFSLLSIAGLAWFVFAYRAAPWMPLWPTIPDLGYVALVLVFLAFFLVVVGGGPTNPTATKPLRMIDNKLPVYGITRVTRHPRLCGLSLWGIAHLLVNGHLAALIMFGTVLVTAVNGMVSIDRKRRHALGPLWDEFAARTSRLPFAAILAGRTGFDITEFRAWQIALAVMLFAGVFWLHGIIGPSPLWAMQM
jgi:uncharacterized membrane protein